MPAIVEPYQSFVAYSNNMDSNMNKQGANGQPVQQQTTASSSEHVPEWQRFLSPLQKQLYMSHQLQQQVPQAVAIPQQQTSNYPTKPEYAPDLSQSLQRQGSDNLAARLNQQAEETLARYQEIQKQQRDLAAAENSKLQQAQAMSTAHHQNPSGDPAMWQHMAQQYAQASLAARPPETQQPVMMMPPQVPNTAPPMPHAAPPPYAMWGAHMHPGFPQQYFQAPPPHAPQYFAPPQMPGVPGIGYPPGYMYPPQGMMHMGGVPGIPNPGTAASAIAADPRQRSHAVESAAAAASSTKRKREENEPASKRNARFRLDLAQQPQAPVRYAVDRRGRKQKLCIHDGCMKLSKGWTGRCIAHGGGFRCKAPGCNKHSQGGSLCISHGGGKRCTTPGCTKAAQSGFSVCAGHGGHRRCRIAGCGKVAQRKGKLCSQHWLEAEEQAKNEAKLASAAAVKSESPSTTVAASKTDKPETKLEDDSNNVVASNEAINSNEIESAASGQSESGERSAPGVASSTVKDATPDTQQAEESQVSKESSSDGKTADTPQRESDSTESHAIVNEETTDHPVQATDQPKTDDVKLSPSSPMKLGKDSAQQAPAEA